MRSIIYIIRAALNIALSLLQYSVIIECIMSWIPDVTRSGIYEFLRRINGVFLNPIRKIMMKYTYGMPLDISPIILFMIIGLIRSVL